MNSYITPENRKHEIDGKFQSIFAILRDIGNDVRHDPNYEHFNTLSTRACEYLQGYRGAVLKKYGKPTDSQ